MKRFISILLALAITLGLCSCTKEKKTNIIDDNYRNWYEIFVYSFYDSDGDGIGDLRGVTEKLDYIADMGFNGIWLMPVFCGTSYHKYDVTDYYNIDPEYGTLADFDELIEQAHKRGIKVIIDLALNHTSVEHPWFTEAVEYIKANGEAGGEYGTRYNFTTEPPISGYSRITGTDYYYESQFWSGMPDLNLDDDATRTEIENILSFWLGEHNCDGFRLDATTYYYTGIIGKNVEFLSWVNDTAKSCKSDCYIVGEAWETSDVTINNYYASGIDSFFLFTSAQATGTLANLVRKQLGSGFAALMTKLQNIYTEGTLAPFLGNHDTTRPASFMGSSEDAKMAGGLLLMMNGNVFVYYGEEIGMLSKGGAKSDPAKRIAMYWDSGDYQGKCYKSPEDFYVDDSSYLYGTVADQLDDESSFLNYYKQALHMRNLYPEIARGEVADLSSEELTAVGIIRKTYEGSSIIIALNLSQEEQTVLLDKGEYGISDLGEYLCVDSTQQVKYSSGTLTLPPQSIAVLK